MLGGMEGEFLNKYFRPHYQRDRFPQLPRPRASLTTLLLSSARCGLERFVVAVATRNRRMIDRTRYIMPLPLPRKPAGGRADARRATKCFCAILCELL